MGNTYTPTKLIKTFILIIGLSSPLSRIIVFTVGLVTLALLPTQNLKYLPIRSVYEDIFHIKLYSAGITRSVSMILHGDFFGAWQLNKLSYLIIITVLILLIKDFYYLNRTRKFHL